MSFFQMKGVSTSAAQSLYYKSAHLTWKASEVQSAESLNLDALVGIGFREAVVCRGASAAIIWCCVFFYVLLMIWGASLLFMGSEP